MAKNIILHLGLGAFHRAHQAVYLHKLHGLGETDWELWGANLRPSPNSLKSLKEAGGTFFLETSSPRGEYSYKKITSIKRVFEYSPKQEELAAAALAPEIKIISCTVTEAGYYLNLQSQLQSEAPDITADLETCGKAQPGSASLGNTIYGALYCILRNRQARLSNSKLTLLCCDNLRNNGTQLKKGLFQFIALMENHDLLEWVKKQVSFPHSMVDRITPRPTEAVIRRVEVATEACDLNAVTAESFIQWVIEDDFAAGRPAWEKVGVELVGDVAPYEEAKIRLLNATHSCIAWAGSLKGYRYIHEGVNDLAIKKLAYNYLTQDAIPILQPSPLDLFKYRDVVLNRFSNPALKDTNQRVAMDGFSKIPGFIAPTIRERILKKQPIFHVSVLAALFLAFLQARQAGKLKYVYEDQAMNPNEAAAICLSANPLVSFCANKTLWGALANHPRLVEAVGEALKPVRKLANN